MSRRKKEPPLPFPTEGQVFWTWFWVMAAIISAMLYKMC